MAVWLPYGSDDSSVVFRHSLKHAFASNPSTGLETGEICPYTSRTIIGDAAGPTYDATNGLTAKASGGTANSGIFLSGGISAATLAALDAGGQISFEVQRDWLCDDGLASSDSSGYTPAATECALNARATAAATGELTVYKLTTHAFQVNMHGANSQAGSMIGGVYDSGPTNTYINSIGKDDWVTVNIGWIGGQVGGHLYVAVDGLLMTGEVKTTAFSSIFGRLYFGSNGTTAYMNGYYIRNVQISTKPPNLTVNHRLRSIGILSDSILGSYKYYTFHERDCSAYATMHRTIEKGGFLAAPIEVQYHDGHQIFLGNSASFKSAGHHTTLRNKNKKIIFINGGVNDSADIESGATTEAEFKAALNEYCEYFLGSKCTEGVYGYTADLTTCELVYLVTPGDSNSGATRKLTYASIRQWMQDVVDAWDTSYPSAAGRVAICDVWGDWGGPTFPSGWLETDNVHPKSQGNYYTGVSLGNTILNHAMHSEYL